MIEIEDFTAPSRLYPDHYLRGAAKFARGASQELAPDSVVTRAATPQRKPDWLRVRAPTGVAVTRVKRLLRAACLNTVCEEARCPNLGECFSRGTATFMILGALCTRRCAFCDVAHGQPAPPDPDEPERLAAAIATLGLHYAVITSVTRDDLRDGGASHFAACLTAARTRLPEVALEILVPDFRQRETRALKAFTGAALPDVFNHNLETVPRLYPQVRPGADYHGSLRLLARFKELHPAVPTKSGLMLGLGEHEDEVLAVMADLRAHGCERLTLGQYLPPTAAHLAVQRYWTPDEFKRLAVAGTEMGFSQVASGVLVRSSYRAEEQAARAGTAQ